MKEFVTPTLVDLDINETAEGNFSGSGAHNPDPTAPPIPPEQPISPGCWSFPRCTWTGHNNGGHSICHVEGKHSGDHSGNCLVMNFTAYNFLISDVKNASGFFISNVTPNGFTLTRVNHFNENDNVGFNVEIVTSSTFYDEAGNLLHGAIGAKNADYAYVEVTSYYCF